MTATPRDHVRRIARGPWPAAAALAGYVAFALFVTWPWVLDPGGTLYGVVGGDMTSNIAGFEQLAEERQVPFLPGKITQVNAPEGLETNWALHLAAIGSSTTLWLLALAFGSITAHGIVAVLGYALTAFSMFLLARWVTGHAGASFVAGLAFGFWPYTYGTGYTWPHFIHLWVFVLLVWRMLVVADRPTLLNGVLAGAAAALALTWIPYNLLIAGVVYATLAAVALGRSFLRGTWHRQLAAQAASAAIVGSVLIVMLVAGRVTDYAGVPTRSSVELVQNSARPAMYVVPGPSHPLLGDRTVGWVYDMFSPTVPNPPPDKAIYADIYLGVSLLLLAAVGAVWVVWSILSRSRSRRRRLEVGLVAMILGAVGLAFSAPPRVTVLGVVIPMPYALVERVTMVFRVPHRFAIVVMLAACLLAALGLVWMLERRSLPLRGAILAAVAAIVAVDLSALPSPRTTKVGYAPIYSLLERQPRGIVAEYPLNRGPTVESLQSLYQDVHGQRLFMGAPVGSETESRKLELQYLLAARTVPDLAAYGVDYVLVHHLPDVPPRPAEPVRGLRFIGGNADSSLYRVAAAPSGFSSYGVSGFHLTEGAPPGMRWLAANGAKLELRGRCRPCVGTVTFPASSFAVPRSVSVTGERGETLSTTRVGTVAELVRFPVRFSERSVVRLSTNPPPVRIDSVIPGPDTRTVSIALGQPVRFTPDPRRGHRPIP